MREEGVTGLQWALNCQKQSAPGLNDRVLSFGKTASPPTRFVNTVAHKLLEGRGLMAKDGGVPVLPDAPAAEECEGCLVKGGNVSRPWQSPQLSD